MGEKIQKTPNPALKQIETEIKLLNTAISVLQKRNKDFIKKTEKLTKKDVDWLNDNAIQIKVWQDLIKEKEKTKTEL